MAFRKVVLTAPHYRCMWQGMPREQMRCEPETRRAIRAAGAAARRCGLKTKALFGNLFREVVDLNRPEGRETKFRQKVEREFDKQTVVLDVHTSPPEAFDEGTDVMVLVSGRGMNREFATEMAGRLEERGLKVELKPASRVNDIVEQAGDRTAGAVLLELNPAKDVERSSSEIGNALCDWGR